LDTSGLVEIEDAVNRTGRSRSELQDLVRAGHLKRVEKNSRTYLREQGLDELAKLGKQPSPRPSVAQVNTAPVQPDGCEGEQTTGT